MARVFFQSISFHRALFCLQLRENVFIVLIICLCDVIERSVDLQTYEEGLAMWRILMNYWLDDSKTIIQSIRHILMPSRRVKIEYHE